MMVLAGYVVHALAGSYAYAGSNTVFCMRTDPYSWSCAGQVYLYKLGNRSFRVMPNVRKSAENVQPALF
jgi:hypothetical protein